MKEIPCSPKFLQHAIVYCAAPLTPPAIPALALVAAIDGVPVAGSIPLFAVAFAPGFAACGKIVFLNGNYILIQPNRHFLTAFRIKNAC